MKTVYIRLVQRKEATKPHKTTTHWITQRPDSSQTSFTCSSDFAATIAAGTLLLKAAALI